MPYFARRLQGLAGGLLFVYGQRNPSGLDGCHRRTLGQLSAEDRHDGADLMIAATALEHGMQGVHANVRHFIPTGVQC